MLKFSMSVRVTNSIRHLTPWEAERGRQVCGALETPPGKALRRRFPQFHWLAEPGYMALKDTNGQPRRETIVVFRENPFKGEPGIELSATLTQEHPFGEPTRLGSMVQGIAEREGVAPSLAAGRWFDRFLRVAVEPLIIAQADYGLLFGAHQQNLILGLKEGYPVRAWYRDCQGSGYTEYGETWLRPHFPELGEGSANIVDGDMGARLFVYYLMVNTTFNVIATLAADGLVAEEALMMRLRRFLQELLDHGPRDPSVLQYLLERPCLWHKANLLCNLRDINENTCEDPLSIYTTMPNPLVAAAVVSGQSLVSV